MAKPGSSCASISMESCKKTCNYFFVCHQINGVFVNNNDLDLIRLQLSRGSIYQSAGRTTGPVETVESGDTVGSGSCSQHSAKKAEQIVSYLYSV